jgi:uncharacterized protein (TIGR04552 family)
MEQKTSGQELYHEIFGSILDRTEMTPFLLLPALNYGTALMQATKMMANRGFDILGNSELLTSEKERAQKYIEQAYRYFFDWMLPFFRNQLEGLIALHSSNSALYRHCLTSIEEIESVLKDKEFRRVVDEDPRHLFLLASLRKYPNVFYGYEGLKADVPPEWQEAACSILKMGHLIKSIEEDSQDIDDYAHLGFFLEMQGQRLDDLYHYDWENPRLLPESESAQRAFVKISTFFHKLKESMRFDKAKACLIFDSGDGVEVDIVEIKARLKSPQSMVTKLGKKVETEAYDIRDILAITFILKSMDDTLKLFHALQKRGVILQENTASHSITQTLYDGPESMMEAVRRLMVSLYQSEGNAEIPDEDELFANAKRFYEALSVNAEMNPHSALGHRKFQCKINFSLPIHRTFESNSIIIPGTPLYLKRNQIRKKTQQQTLGIELRISDEQSWRKSEQKGDSHHDAYKFRQVITVMNRLFKNTFHFSEEGFAQLRKDQLDLFG